ncbi:DUF4244 domain-containing protein [Paenarthrobacter sp. JL.01a]|uniref:DUF4244 domain-containing protein n=1 Tax=Paenarthrobacter sp. JL.01a TaxID=2979324 RepID=UPI0021CA3545|nr:DUF4244 domain-containing protein [Paenarthrobacter sp. JL.01a]UXM90967.1 DUF4244 domain-containing protein [Paenarthrobacter sp. JL.01a]
MITTFSPPAAGPVAPARPISGAESRQDMVAVRDPERGDDPVRRGRRPRKGLRSRLKGSESGMATAEYAITTLAAVGLAGLLVVILRSEEVRGFLLNVIRTALSLP